MLSSQEIVALITALGTGIGQDNYDIDKLRYHTIVIMTDADVDGSHIRTLLLTFFFRHFPEIIDRGYLYIAQPPLYKVKAGKKEVYLKNEQGLDDYVVDHALGDLELAIGDQTVSTEVLREVARRGLRYRTLIGSLAREHRPSVVEALLDEVDTIGHAELGRTFSDREKATEMAARLVDGVRKRAPLDQVEFEVEEAVPGEIRVQLRILADGVVHHERVERPLIESAEFSELADVREYVKTLGGPPFVLKRKGQEIAHLDRLETLVDHIGEAGRSGIQIQRYKGLGEMNPDQLWETTMDPGARQLMQVRVGDPVDADTVFSVLMGDDVEPRRNFITENALNARNLDV
jgi:DNA gyrase subunit B